MAASHDRGRRGEELAAALLEERGWAVVDRNYRLGHKEIDLVVRRGRVVAFVEVKARGGAEYGHPLEAITRAKRRIIEHVARDWIARRGRAGERYRFDAVTVIWGTGAAPRIEHVPDAWRIGGP